MRISASAASMAGLKEGKGNGRAATCLAELQGTENPSMYRGTGPGTRKGEMFERD